MVRSTRHGNSVAQRNKPEGRYTKHHAKPVAGAGLPHWHEPSSRLDPGMGTVGGKHTEREREREIESERMSMRYRRRRKQN